MQNLFTTTINIHSKNLAYRVVFDHEQYKFIPETPDASAPSFSFKRENDTWHDQDNMAADVKQQAIGALENYLMAQL